MVLCDLCRIPREVFSLRVFGWVEEFRVSLLMISPLVHRSVKDIKGLVSLVIEVIFSWPRHGSKCLGSKHLVFMKLLFHLMLSQFLQLGELSMYGRFGLFPKLVLFLKFSSKFFLFFLHFFSSPFFKKLSVVFIRYDVAYFLTSIYFLSINSIRTKLFP